MIKKTILIWLCLVLCGFGAFSQDLNDAVVYIQSDKETPIYVKVEGQMMERYSKNYVVLGNLASGPLNLEILFQQNKYPNQKFVLNIPPSSQRSLVLKKIDQNKFALYDLNYGIYLNNGNRLEDDISGSDKEYQNTVLAANTTAPTNEAAVEAVPVEKPKKEKAAPKPKKEKKSEDEIPEFTVAKEAKKNQEETPLIAQEEAEAPKKPKKTRAERRQETEENTSGERFLDFEMDKKESNSGNSRSGTAKNTNPGNNTKCSEPASESQFDNFASLLNTTDDEELKLGIVRKNAAKYCFSTDQVRTIAMNFDSQSSRYEVARVLKAKVVDVDNYAKLSSLFNTNFLKERFKDEVVNK